MQSQRDIPIEEEPDAPPINKKIRYYLSRIDTRGQGSGCCLRV